MSPNLRLLACGLAALALSVATTPASAKGGQITGWNPAPVAGSSKLAPGVKPIAGVHALHTGSSGGGGGRNGGQVSGFSVFTPPSFAGGTSATVAAPGGLQRAPNGSVTHGTAPAGGMGMMSALPTSRANTIGMQGVGNSQAVLQGVGNSQAGASAAMAAQNEVYAAHKKSAAANAVAKGLPSKPAPTPGTASTPTPTKACAGGSGASTACK